MDMPNSLMTILTNEFGISSREELDKAFDRLPAIDIAVFCSAKRKEFGVERIINTGTGILGRETPVHSEWNGDSIRYPGDETSKLA